MPSVSVLLKDAKDLPGMDWGGLSDPYVVLNVGGEEAQSKICYKTVNPHWDTHFTFDGVVPESITGTVWDRNMIEDAEVGSFEIDLDDRFIEDKPTLITIPIKTNDKSKSSVTMEITVNEEDDDSVVDSAESESDDEEFKNELDIKYKHEVKPNRDAAQDGFGDDSLFNVDDDAGAQSMATKAWRGTVDSLEPTDWDDAKINTKKPSHKPELEWVHGYRCWDTRDHILINKDGDLVYPAASTAVLYNKKKHTQRQFVGHHVDDVRCIAMHPNGKYIATGDIGKRPRVCVWDSTSLELLVEIYPTVVPATKVDGPNKGLIGYCDGARGIKACAFSADGKLLGLCTDDDHQTAHVYDWESNQLKANGKAKSPLLNMRYNPYDKSFWTVGVKHVASWQMNGAKLVKRNATVGKKGTLHGFLGLAFTKQATLVGTTQGKIYVFNGGSLSKSIDAHEGSIHTLYASPSGIIASASADGQVKFWSVDLKQKEKISFAGKKVRTIVSDGKSRWIAGTQEGEIYEWSQGQGEPQVIVQGHHQGEQDDKKKYSAKYGEWGELWALATAPSGDTFCTGGDDGTVRVWSAKSHKQVAMTTVGDGARVRSIAYDPEGRTIGVGCWDGEYFFLDAKKLKVLAEGKLKGRTIQNPYFEILDMKWSPTGDFIAIGSKTPGAEIAVMDGKSYKIVGKKDIDGHPKQLDWDSDGNNFRIVTNAWELLFYDTSCQQVTRSSMFKDSEWDTTHTVIGWGQQGLADEYVDLGDVNTIDRSNSGKLCVTGNDSSEVSIYSWPISFGFQPKNKVLAHASHVTRIRFTRDDKYIISTGGGDQCVFQWKVVKA